MTTISCRACISSLKSFEVAITNDHGANPRLRMPRDVTGKAHSNQETRETFCSCQRCQLPAEEAWEWAHRNSKIASARRRSRFCLAPVKQVDFTHSKHGRTLAHVGRCWHTLGTHGYHTGTQAHRPMYSGANIRMLKRFGIAAVSHRLSCALYRSGEWARGRRGLGRASNGAPQTGQGAHEQCDLTFYGHCRPCSGLAVV